MSAPPGRDAEVPEGLRAAANYFYRYLTLKPVDLSRDNSLEKHSFHRPIRYTNRVMRSAGGFLGVELRDMQSNFFHNVVSFRLVATDKKRRRFGVELRTIRVIEEDGVYKLDFADAFVSAKQLRDSPLDPEPEWPWYGYLWPFVDWGEESEGTVRALPREGDEGDEAAPAQASLPVPSGFFETAHELYLRGRYSAAIDAFEDVLDKNPTFHLARFEMGMSYYHRGELRRAIEQFQPVAAQDHDKEVKVRARSMLGIARKRMLQAVEDMNRQATSRRRPLPRPDGGAVATPAPDGGVAASDGGSAIPEAPDGGVATPAPDAGSPETSVDGGSPATPAPSAPPP